MASGRAVAAVLMHDFASVLSPCIWLGSLYLYLLYEHALVDRHQRQHASSVASPLVTARVESTMLW